jgi:hypothetical protein
MFLNIKMIIFTAKNNIKYKEILCRKKLPLQPDVFVDGKRWAVCHTNQKPLASLDCMVGKNIRTLDI